MSKEKVMHLEAMGVNIIFTRSSVEKGHPEHYQDLAAKLFPKLLAHFRINLITPPINGP